MLALMYTVYMTTLYHATRARNLQSILRNGLLCSRSKGARKAVWLAPARLKSWACLHVADRHGGRIEDVIVLEVKVPRSWTKGHKGGLLYCERDIPTSRIGKIVGFRVVAQELDR